MTLIVDTNDGVDGVISLTNTLTGTWELKSSYVSEYKPDAIDVTNSNLLIDRDGVEVDIALPQQVTLDIGAIRDEINNDMGATYITAIDEDKLTMTYTSLVASTLKWSDSDSSILFTNSGADRELEAGEVVTLQFRARDPPSHLKIYVEESWRNNTTTSGESPTFVIPTENLVEIPGQTMQIAGSTNTLTLSVREYGADTDLDFDTMPQVTLVLNQV